MKPIKVETVFIPKEVPKSHNPVCVLVDAIRASCTVIALFEKNFSQILITDDEARSLDSCGMIRDENYCICAEKVEGTKSDVADVSPSLIDLRDFPDGGGRKVLFRTTNGTEGVRALSAAGIGEIYIGAMLNKDAVAKAAVEHAVTEGTGVCIVSAGRENGQIYCIDDAYCCAALIQSVLFYAAGRRYEVDLQDSAKIALSMAKDYKAAEEAFAGSATGEIMRLAASEEDILLCARENISTVVPKVSKIDRYGHIVVDVWSR